MMKISSIILLFAVLPSPALAYRSAEQSLLYASNLETRQQQLRAYEQQLAEREVVLQQQQEQARNQAFQSRLQQQQEAARRREAALQRQLHEQQERAAYGRLQQGMRLSTLQQQAQKAEPAVESREQEAPAYGYARQMAPRPVSEQTTRTMSGKQELPALVSPQKRMPASTQVLILDAPIPVATLAPLESRVQTGVSGIDRIETSAILPESLNVEQLRAVKQIADRGALIAQQRLGVEQFRLEQRGRVSRLEVLKGFVLWGLLLSIPTLLALSWIVRNLAFDWRKRQQDTIAYKLKELESVERQIAITEREFDADRHH